MGNNKLPKDEFYSASNDLVKLFRKHGLKPNYESVRDYLVKKYNLM